jgi:hypothetical protein
VTDPFATAATRPDTLIVAIISSDDDHVNVVPEIAFPLASLALAVSYTVSPREESMEFSGVTTTEATAGGPFPVGVSLPQARTDMVEKATARQSRGLHAWPFILWKQNSVLRRWLSAVWSSGGRPTGRRSTSTGP